MADEQHGLQWDYNNGGLDPGEPTSINTISRAFLSTVTRCTVGLTLGLGPNIRDSGAKPPRSRPSTNSITESLFWYAAPLPRIYFIAFDGNTAERSGTERTWNRQRRDQIRSNEGTNVIWERVTRKNIVKLLLEKSTGRNFLFFKSFFNSYVSVNY